MNNLLYTREATYDSNIILIDGFSGAGKVLINDLIKASNQVEVAIYDVAFDYLPILYEFGGIDPSAATSLIKTRLDEAIYNLCISRNINCRIKDIFSIFKHPKKLYYLTLLLKKAPDDHFIANNLTPKLNLPIWTHATSFNNDLYQKAFGARLKTLYALRDPLFSVENQSTYMKRILRTPREYVLKYSHEGIEYPWYSRGWESEFSQCNYTEKSIKILKNGYESLFKKINNLKIKQHVNYKIIFFEDLTINTNIAFNEVMSYLNLGYNKNYFHKLMSRNKLPRNSLDIVDGYWIRYTEDSISREGESANILLNRIRNQVREKYYEMLILLIEDYHEFKAMNS